MEAESRPFRVGVDSWIASERAALALMLALIAGFANAASYRTQNFIVQAPSSQLAKEVGDSAERYRNDLAVYWTGQALRPWPAPCPIRVIAGPTLAAQGVTTYNPAPVRDFQMEVVGTPERILDSVLPHEVTHTILATYFGRPLPRWADEGICTTVEHSSERNKHEVKLREFLRSRRGIAMNKLFLLREYPSDVLPMYAQGYSVCRFLIDQKGPRTFVQFLHDYIEHPSWTQNVRRHYGYDSLAELQEYWLAWVGEGSGPVERFAKAREPRGVDPAESIALVAPIQSTPRALPNPVAAPQNAQRELPAELIQPGPATRALAQTFDSPQANDHTLGTTLANVDRQSGWYQRRRQQARAGNLAGNLSQDQGPAVRPIVPPSVRGSGRYQAAQPQPEGRMSRSGPPVEPVSQDLSRFR